MSYNLPMLRIMFYTIIIVLVLSFFGVSLQSIVHSPAGESNFSYLWDLVLAGFHFIVNLLASVYLWIIGLFTHQ